MFTGIIDHLGRIERLEERGEGARLAVRFESGSPTRSPECSGPSRRPDAQSAGPSAALGVSPAGSNARKTAQVRLQALSIGASIAVNGCCLTIVERDAGSFEADLSTETLRRTSFRELKPGRLVNLEQPVVAGKEFGGHFVQGHIDGVGRVERLAEEAGSWWLVVRPPEALARYMAVKGSVAIDGISLTIAGAGDGGIEAAIVPYTFSCTNISELTIGDPVNLECDILAKYVERLLEARGEKPAGRVTLARLLEEGF